MDNKIHEINPEISYASSYEQTRLLKNQAIDILKNLENTDLNSDTLEQLRKLFDDIVHKYIFDLNITEDKRKKLLSKIQKLERERIQKLERERNQKLERNDRDYIINKSKILIGYIDKNLKEGIIKCGSIFYDIHELVE